MRGDELEEGGKEQKICFSAFGEKLACNPPVHTIGKATRGPFSPLLCPLTCTVSWERGPRLRKLVPSCWLSLQGRWLGQIRAAGLPRRDPSPPLYAPRGSP